MSYLKPVSMWLMTAMIAVSAAMPIAALAQDKAPDKAAAVAPADAAKADAPKADAAAAAATAAAAAAAAAPSPNHGDTAWMMTATAFVILMTIPGLALFYGGLVRTKNMLSV